MPLSVQVAVLANQSPQKNTDRSSSSATASVEGSRESAFSNHFEAERHVNSGSVGGVQEKAADKPNEVVDAEVDGDAKETPIDLQEVVMGGNELPPAGAIFPVGLESVEAELLHTQSETPSSLAQQMAVEVDTASVTAALHQWGLSNGVEQGGLNSALHASKKTAYTLAMHGPTTDIKAELARVLSGKEAPISGEFVDTAVDVEIDDSLNIEFLAGKITRPLLEGVVSNTTIKIPTAQAIVEALSNGSGPKENFEHVRQNILAAMVGKSELGSSAVALTSGADGGDSAPQSLNFSNVSSTLSVPSAESAKYSATTETPPPRFFTLQTPVGQTGWDAEIGNRIRWMVGQNNSGLELRLNPAELGSVDVRLNTEGERTSVTFFAANPAAREALEAALPRLREMFADSGMQLANADVSDQSLQQEREQLADSDARSPDGKIGKSMNLDIELELIPGRSAENKNVIDYYI
ncbi:MAG: flagellar hook-length control protein FliK [Porticoccaceae bacterium]|nr:flagellar hook-length control protein FliK [Porticoccaceae bacterium]